MADNNITLKRITGSGTSDNLYPRTNWDQVLNKPTTFTPTSHTHGNISNAGVLTNSAVTVGTGDFLVIGDTSTAAVERSTIAFGTSTTTFLRNDGSWANPSGGGGGGSGNVSTSGTITANTIPYWVDTTSIGTLATSTYPSLTELSYVKGVTSALQTQLNGKQATITGGATTITSSNLTASRALISDTSGKVAVSLVTSTELGYLDGVTSAIQTQINGIQFDPQRTQLFSATSSSSDTTYTATTGNYSTYKMLYLEIDRGGIQKSGRHFRISDIGDGVGGSGAWMTLLSTSTTNGTSVVMMSISRASSSGTGNTFRVRTSGLGTSYTIRLFSLGNID
jgi:hypothetical protein